MIKWTTIGEVFRITSGGTPLSSLKEYYDNGVIPWVNTGDLKTRHLTIDKIPKKITKLGLENSSAKTFPPNTVLVAIYGASIGNCSILKIEAATNQACAALLPVEDQSEEFLYFYLLSIQDHLIGKGQGGGQPNISADILKKTKFPQLPLDTQHQIVAVLDKAQSIIDKRQASLQLLDQLMKDTFLDMFGDTVINPKGWEKEKLGKYIDFLTSGSRGWAQHYTEKPGSIFLRIQNVGRNEMLNDDFTFVKEPKTQEAIRTKVQPRDVLVSITADLGRSCVVPELPHSAYINQHLCIIRLNNDLNPHFLSALFASPGGQYQFLGLDKGGVKAGLNFDDIRNFKITVPPVEIQKKYEDFRNEITIVKSGLRKSDTYSESLFQSLLQKAFKGELQIEADATLLEEARQSVEWLQKQTEALPQTKPVSNLNKKLILALGEIALDNLPEMVSGAKQLWNYFRKKGTAGFEDIKTIEEAKEVAKHDLFSLRDTKQVAKLLIEHVGQQEQIRQKEEEAELNDSVMRYLNETDLGEVKLGRLKINLVKFVKRHFGQQEFHVNDKQNGDLGDLLASEANFTGVWANEIKKAVFEIIDKLIAEELWEQPFTFWELQEYLRSLNFLPDFEILTEYVFTALNKEPPLLRQVFMDEKVQNKSMVVYQLLQERQPDSYQWDRKIYLLHN